MSVKFQTVLMGTIRCKSLAPFEIERLGLGIVEHMEGGVVVGVQGKKLFIYSKHKTTPCKKDLERFALAKVYVQAWMVSKRAS